MISFSFIIQLLNPIYPNKVNKNEVLSFLLISLYSVFGNQYLTC